MNNLEQQLDDLGRLADLKQKHRELDDFLKAEYGNITSSPEVYRLKTKKLWLKDEIHRLESNLAVQVKSN